MAELSDDECLTISRFPLEPTIGHLRQPLLAIIAPDEASSDNGQEPGKDAQEPGKEAEAEETDPKDTVSSLLLALTGHRVARKLRSRDSGGTVAGELATIYARLDSDRIGIETFNDLIEAAARKATDIELWKQVLRVIATTSQLTPPPSAQDTEAAFGGTPRSINSASHLDSEQSKELLEDALRDELWDCSYVNVPGFFDKYFDGTTWTEKGKQVYDSVKHTHSQGRWTTFPAEPTESAVWSWWTQFQDEHLTDSRGRYFTTRNKKEMVGVGSESQLDMLVKSRKAPATNTHATKTHATNTHAWADVHVIGEHTISTILTQGVPKFLQLARYARNIFLAQPRRRFVHGFILYNTKLQLHVFDRSGTYNAEPFDIHEEPERFIRVIAGYCMMSDEELGLDTFVERKAGKQFVAMVDDSSGEDLRMQLASQPLARQAAIVGRGTSCFLTADTKHVAKFSWVSTTRSRTEPDLLRLARDRKVKGIPILLGHCRITTIGELRSPLKFSQKRQLQSRQRKSESLSNRFEPIMEPFEAFKSVGKGDSRKRKSTDQGSGSGSGLKKSRSNSKTSSLSQVSQAVDGFNASETQTSFTSRSASEPFIDRVLSCQVTRPAGRSLASFRSVLELLRALRDAIKVHLSLFLDGEILHRDVSMANIIITNPDENDGFSGTLIDLELGTVLENGKNTRTEGKRMTGTLKYMAIEVVQLALRDSRRDLEHTYRHDLESFFYVFLSLCIQHGWPQGQGPTQDPFQSWYIGTYSNIAVAKLGHMGLNGFEAYILPSFSPTFTCVKQLAVTLRDALFLRARGGKLRTGTPTEAPQVLYDQMINAFDAAIKSLEG